MTKFNAGWFNCFCSFISEFINQHGVDFDDRIVINVARAAGITPKEIDSAIKIEPDEDVKNILIRIKDDISES